MEEKEDKAVEIYENGEVTVDFFELIQRTYNQFEEAFKTLKER